MKRLKIILANLIGCSYAVSSLHCQHSNEPSDGLDSLPVFVDGIAWGNAELVLYDESEIVNLQVKFHSAVSPQAYDSVLKIGLYDNESLHFEFDIESSEGLIVFVEILKEPPLFDYSSYADIAASEGSGYIIAHQYPAVSGKVSVVVRNRYLCAPDSLEGEDYEYAIFKCYDLELRNVRIDRDNGPDFFIDSLTMQKLPFVF
jgi:hypothetical protein